RGTGRNEAARRTRRAVSAGTIPGHAQGHVSSLPLSQIVAAEILVRPLAGGQAEPRPRGHEHAASGSPNRSDILYSKHGQSPPGQVFPDPAGAIPRTG